MKRWLWVLVMAMVLAGCGSPQAFETMSDVYAEPDSVPYKQVMLTLPEDAAVQAMGTGETAKLYFCDGYSLALETMQSGDLDRTIRSVSGYAKEALTVMERRQDRFRRYDFIWTCAGEGGDHVGRASILDDGSYHYVLSVMAPSKDAGALSKQWRDLFDSFTLEVSTETTPPGTEPGTGQ